MSLETKEEMSETFAKLRDLVESLETMPYKVYQEFDAVQKNADDFVNSDRLESVLNDVKSAEMKVRFFLMSVGEL